MLSPKHKVLAVTGVLALVLGILLLVPVTRFVVAAGTPDAYGNKIDQVKVLQYQSSAWVLKGTVLTAAYTSGYDISIDPCNKTRIYVRTWLNGDFASTTAQAQTFSRAYVTIASEVAKTLCTKVNSTAGGGGFYVWHYYEWNPDSESAGKPYAGVTYAVVVEFDAYFDILDYTP